MLPNFHSTLLSQPRLWHNRWQRPNIQSRRACTHSFSVESIRRHSAHASLWDIRLARPTDCWCCRRCHASPLPNYTNVHTWESCCPPDSARNNTLWLCWAMCSCLSSCHRHISWYADFLSSSTGCRFLLWRKHFRHSQLPKLFQHKDNRLHWLTLETEGESFGNTSGFVSWECFAQSFHLSGHSIRYTPFHPRC